MRLLRYNFARSFITYFRTTSQIFNVICAFFIALLHNLYGNTNSAHIHPELASITEFAGHTLAMSSSSSSSIALSNRNWLADTVATSHMTPHRHWVHNYIPLRIPIRLADNRVIYSNTRALKFVLTLVMWPLYAMAKHYSVHLLMVTMLELPLLVTVPIVLVRYANSSCCLNSDSAYSTLCHYSTVTSFLHSMSSLHSYVITPRLVSLLYIYTSSWENPS